MIDVDPKFYSGFDLNDPDDVESAEGLILLFRSYIANRGHAYAGKDVPYHKPANTVVTDVNLRHVHLKPIMPTPAEVKKWTRDRTSDRCLVYARSDCGRYLLIAYLNENAHAQAYDLDFIKALAWVGQNWMLKENIFPDLNQPF